MRILILGLVAILLLFQYDFWFGKNGYLDYKEVQEQILTHRKENEKLSQRNQVLAAEIHGLTKGVDAIEERARFNYNMIKPHETFYHIVKEQK